ncbi:YfiT family bacillithiol transferase [Paenibacillus soyae]|uniref:Metal-dependent hydrolase n=1 Tax=Paenibacillus soyae TaxID=2969249 RepID=A0A9X2S782_9BACL|nr:putative metal-dependent hydrolase [Paenibacillus soyae]MCR2802775.1 putative metal-dependent hydrolase [Paenibacillus soyae]
MLDEVRYPIGRFEGSPYLTIQERQEYIRMIPELVGALRSVLNHLDSTRLSSPYRPEGWTPTQIVHHLADNDMNAYLRFKRALTEHNPSASSYREDLWGALHDYQTLPIEHSLVLLEALHYRFHVLLTGMMPEEFTRTLVTEALGQVTLDMALQRFVWHHRHHRAHIHSIIGERSSDPL